MNRKELVMEVGEENGDGCCLESFPNPAPNPNPNPLLPPSDSINE